MTVKDLKKKLNNLPDDMPVKLVSWYGDWDGGHNPVESVEIEKAAPYFGNGGINDKELTEDAVIIK